MLARKAFSDDPTAAVVDVDPGAPCLRSALDAEHVNTHALLLLYLMPVANRSDVDPNTVQAVEALSDVQNRLITPTSTEPFNKDSLALIYSTVAAIRFGAR